MAVENTNFIDGLDATKPDGSAPKSEGDDHLRLVKGVLQHCFAGFDGEVLLAASEAQGATANDYVLTVSPAPAAYAANTLVVFKASHANTGAATLKIGSLAAVSIVNPEGTALRANALVDDCVAMAICDGTNFRLLAGNSQAIYDYVDQTQFQSALPGQVGNGGKFLTTDGTDASWAAAQPIVASAPVTDIGPVYVIGYGDMEWQGGAYAPRYTKASIGLGNVDNTSDANKPVSTATQAALNGKFNATGGTLNGAITANSVVSKANVFTGNGSAYIATNGDVFGSAWGGLLSTSLNNSFNNKVQVRGGFGGSGYVMNNSANQVFLAWDGTGISAQVDSTGMGRMWTTNNFNPSAKQDAGNYVSVNGAGIQFTWNVQSGTIRVIVNGQDIGRMEIL